PDPGANAALKYWQAFAALPRFTDAQQKKLNAECLTMPLDAHARQTVTRAAYSLRLMHRGAALRRCAWALDLEEGIAARFHHAEAAGVLSSLACLRARLRFEEGHHKEAIDDLVSALTLGRHVSVDDSLIGLWVGSRTIEHQVSEALALHLPRLDTRTLKDLK